MNGMSMLIEVNDVIHQLHLQDRKKLKHKEGPVYPISLFLPRKWWS
jgi:hypothetical protein